MIRHILARTLPFFCKNQLTRDKFKQRFLYLQNNGLQKFLQGHINYYLSKLQPVRISTELAVVAIIKNEAPYLREWLEFYKLVGVEKFFIYDNESTDDTKEILAPYIQTGEVIYKYFPGKVKQIPAYQDALNKYRNKVRWFVVVDADEFMTPITYDTIPEFIDALVKKVGKNVDAIGVNWLIHGFNGHYEKPQGLVCENFSKCTFSDPVNTHIKSIINPRAAILAHNPHFFIYKFGAKIVDARGEDMYGAFNPTYFDEIRVEHYWSKSFEEHKERIAKACADSTRPKKSVPYSPDFLSVDENNSMDRFIPLLKEKLNIN